jgi:hypothetical protein
MTGDIEIFPELKIKTLPTLLAALRQPGPRRDVYQQKSGRYVVSFDLLPVRAEVVREAIASGAIVETYPGKNAPYWRLPEMVEKSRRLFPGGYRKRRGGDRRKVV